MRKILLLLFAALFLAACSDDDKKSSKTVYSDGTENGHEYVDLGLTSGTKWATYNIGASGPTDFGNYYAWGETTPQASKAYDWSSYTQTEYKSAVLDSINDAAAVNWGGKWKMPTKDQLTELCGECYWVWTNSYNSTGVAGYIVYKVKSDSDKGVKVYSGSTPSDAYSLSDAHIFLPAAGMYSGSTFLYANVGVRYWSSSISSTYTKCAWRIYSGMPSHDKNYSYIVETTELSYNESGRCDGLSVRAVCQ